MNPNPLLRGNPVWSIEGLAVAFPSVGESLCEMTELTRFFCCGNSDFRRSEFSTPAKKTQCADLSDFLFKQFFNIKPLFLGRLRAATFIARSHGPHPA